MNVVAPIILMVIFLMIWGLLIRTLDIPKWMLPSPITILKECFISFKYFLPHIAASIATAVGGFFIAIPIGIVIAAILSNSKFMDSAFTPFILFIITTPMVTFVPLLMLWIGSGIAPKLIAIVIQSTGIIMLNSVTGFINVQTIRLELMKSLKASRFKTFTKVIFPSALPYVFTGLRLGAIFAMTTAISVEFIAGVKGLGAQILVNSQIIKPEKSFAAIFYVAIIGIVLYTLIIKIKKRVTKGRI